MLILCWRYVALPRPRRSEEAGIETHKTHSWQFPVVCLTVRWICKDALFVIVVVPKCFFASDIFSICTMMTFLGRIFFFIKITTLSRNIVCPLKWWHYHAISLRRTASALVSSSPRTLLLLCSQVPACTGAVPDRRQGPEEVREGE